MSNIRKVFTNEFKTKIVIEAIKGYKTITEISQGHNLHAILIGQWEKQYLENASIIFYKTRGIKKMTTLMR